MRVILTECEMNFAELRAANRRMVNQICGIADKKDNTPLSTTEIDLLGSVSELAWDKAWDKFPDFNVNPRRGTSDSTMSGFTFDIKATRAKDGRLMLRDGKQLSDVFVLAIVDDRIVEFVGYAHGEELANAPLVNMYGHDRHALSQSQLHPIGLDLISRLEEWQQSKELVHGVR